MAYFEDLSFRRYITEFYVEVSSQQEGYWLRKMKKVIFSY
jgi:hypothetical protein